MSAEQHPGGEPDEVVRLKARLARERRARREAEIIAERATGELYQAVQKLGESNDVLEEANQTIRDYVAIASHDLRGPLTVLEGYAALLTDEWESTEEGDKRDAIAAIERQAKHLRRLSDDLLTVSQIDAGVMRASAEELSVAELLEMIGSELGGLVGNYSWQCPSGLTVIADPDHLHRILTNYVGNAGKYGRPPVVADAEPVGPWIEVRVTDYGSGVPDDFVPRLFAKFARAPSASKSVDGTGLGLSIVRGLAEINGGEAWYEPNRPHGSKFGLRLPRPD